MAHILCLVYIWMHKVWHTSYALFTFGCIKYGTHLMPCLHLACSELTVTKMPVSPFQCGLRTEAAGGHMIIVQIHRCSSLYDYVQLSTVTNFKKIASP